MLSRNVLSDLGVVVPWWTDVLQSASEALRSRASLAGLRVAIICIDLYRFDSISTSVCEHALVLAAAGCDVRVVCNNHTGTSSPLFESRDQWNPSDYDFLIYQYYVGDDLIEKVASSNVPKAVYYQGITTPPEVYAPFSPDFVATCTEGLRHLSSLHRFDALFVASDYNAKQVMSAAPDQSRLLPTYLFPPVITVSRFAGEPKGFSAVPTHILSVGRLYSSKNIEGVLTFAESLARLSGAPTRLTLAGSKCEPAYVQHLLSGININSRLEVDICLRASDKRVRELYAEADVYACFSHHEGFCIPLVEAMAAGVPVVSHAVSAIAQTMGGAGIVVEPNDYEGAAMQLLEMWSKAGQLEGMVAAQRSLFEQRYDGALIAGQLIDAVRELTLPKESRK